MHKTKEDFAEDSICKCLKEMEEKVILKLHTQAELTQPCRTKSKCWEQQERAGRRGRENRETLCLGGDVSILVRVLQGSVASAHEV